MKYTVLWVPGAEQELAAVWNDAADRNAVTRASHRIDAVLRADPENQGESRSDGRRVLLEPPLGVLYRVDSDDCKVHVLTVWQFE